ALSGISGTTYGTSDRLEFVDNIAANGQYGIKGDNCNPGMTSLNTYAPGATVTGNVVVAGKSAEYPSGNAFPATWDAVGFEDLAGGNFSVHGTYEGKGADLDAIEDAREDPDMI